MTIYLSACLFVCFALLPEKIHASPSVASYKKQGRKGFWSTSVSCKDIRDMSSVPIETKNTKNKLSLENQALLELVLKIKFYLYTKACPTLVSIFSWHSAWCFDPLASLDVVISCPFLLMLRPRIWLIKEQTKPSFVTHWIIQVTIFQQKLKEWLVKLIFPVVKLIVSVVK